MNSLEIAELTGKNHADVMRDIKKMVKGLDEGGGISRFADTYQNEQNKQSYPCFNLPHRETDVLFTNLSEKRRRQ
jgi:phage regulator Rha-like protein